MGSGEYALANDIDASKMQQPIPHFNGTLHGNGHTVSGNQACLFAQLEGQVENLHVTGANIHSAAQNEGESTATHPVGAVACQIGPSGSLRNVSVSNSTLSSANEGQATGGVAGENRGNIEHASSHNNTITTTGDTSDAGGILGVHGAQRSGSASHLSASDNTITTQGKHSSAGGAIGSARAHSTTHHLSAHQNTVSTSGHYAEAGGAIGENHGTLTQVNSLDNLVSTTGAAAAAGGVTGGSTSSSSTLHAHSTENRVHTTGKEASAGGVTGESLGINGHLHSHNNTLTSDGAQAPVGGVIGHQLPDPSIASPLNPLQTSTANEELEVDEEDDVGSDYEYDDDENGDYDGDYSDELEEENTPSSSHTDPHHLQTPGATRVPTATSLHGHNNTLSTTGAESAVGGIAGVNQGVLSDATATSSRIQTTGDGSHAGGVVGLNQGVLSDSRSTSSTIHTTGDGSQVGGNAGVNGGIISRATADSQGLASVGSNANVGGNIGEQNAVGLSQNLQARNNTMVKVSQESQPGEQIGLDLSNQANAQTTRPQTETTPSTSGSGSTSSSSSSSTSASTTGSASTSTQETPTEDAASLSVTLPSLSTAVFVGASGALLIREYVAGYRAGERGLRLLTRPVRVALESVRSLVRREPQADSEQGPEGRELLDGNNGNDAESQV